MIRALVDFALKSRWMVLGGVVVLTAWGVISFRNLPIEAYPDVANNYVQIITQWPGRSAEEIERQVTVPVEIQMAGIPHLTHLRSTTLAGLSSLMLIFDDNSTSDMNREHVLERLSQVNLPAEPRAADGHGLEPCRPDLLVHAGEHQSRIRRDGEEVARRLDPRKIVQERSRCCGCVELWRADQGVPGPSRSRTNWSPTACRLRRSSSNLPPTTPMAAAASLSRVRSRSMCNRWASSARCRTSRTPSSRRRMARQCAVKDIATVMQGTKDSPRTDRPRHASATTGRSSTIPTPWKALCSCRRAMTPIRFSRAFTKKSTSSIPSHSSQGRQSCAVPRSIQACLSSRWRPWSTT